MAVSSFKGTDASNGGGGGSKDFVLNVNSNTTYGLDRTYSSGRYSIELSDSDSTFDIYAITENGLYAGYTNTNFLEAGEDFSEVVVLGVASGYRISFSYLGVLNTAITSGDVATAGAFINSVGTSSLPDIDDFTVVNGGNFAPDVEVSFIDQSAVETAAKSISRSSSAELLITRPDSFSPDDSPYTVKVVNPGIPVPSGSNAHLLSNSITAGTNPVWTTASSLYIPTSGSVSVALLASDTEGADIDYSIISGSLPAGLSLDNESGVISGTVSLAEGDSTVAVFRAIDTGGNYLDKTITIIANNAPVWTTAAGALTAAESEASYSNQLVASGGDAAATLTYTITGGSLPTGISLSSTGLLSGNSSEAIGTTSSFVVRASDDGGAYTERSFTLLTKAPLPIATGGSITNSGGYRYHIFNSSATFEITKAGDVECYIIAGAGSGGADSGGAGGGGAGGVLVSTVPMVAIGSYPIVVGAGGGGSQSAGNDGGVSTALSLSAVGGGGGGGYPRNGRQGGSGGGGAGWVSASGGAGEPGQGNNGGRGGGTSSSIGGGGGGSSSVGNAGSGNNSASGDGGTGITILGNQYAGGGGGGANTGFNPGEGSFGGGNGGTRNSNNATAATKRGSGGGGGGSMGGAGFAGVVILRYPTA